MTEKNVKKEEEVLVVPPQDELTTEEKNDILNSEIDNLSEEDLQNVENMMNDEKALRDAIEQNKQMIADLSPEERAEFIAQFNDQEDNRGFIKIVDGTPDTDIIKEYEKQLEETFELIKNKKILVSLKADHKKMTKYLTDLIQNHLIWKGSWWKTVLTLVDRLNEGTKEATEKKSGMELDFPSIYALNMILNEEPPMSNFEGAKFFEKNFDNSVIYGTRIATSYAYISNISKISDILRKAIGCIELGLNVEITLPEVIEITPEIIKLSDEKAQESLNNIKKL